LTSSNVHGLKVGTAIGKELLKKTVLRRRKRRTIDIL